MRFIDCAQGSEEWHLARAGVTTASDFADAVAITGGLDEKQQAYVDALKAGKSETEARLVAGYKNKPSSSGIERALAGLPVGEPADPAIRLAVKKAIERISKKPYGNTGGNFYASCACATRPASSCWSKRPGCASPTRACSAPASTGWSWTTG